MTITVKKVTNKRDLNEFINLPWQIYANDPNWVPPLKSQVKDILSADHPFLDHGSIDLFLAYIDNQAVGRIAAIENTRYNSFHSEKSGFFGFFECINDTSVAQALFDQAKSELAKRGLNNMIGPASPSTNYECGLLIDGYEDPAQIMTSYNPSYYQQLLVDCGFTKAKDLFALDIPIDYQIPDTYFQNSQKIEQANHITWRYLDKKNWERDIQFIEGIYNESWEKNWGFVPMSKKEFHKLASNFKQIAEEKLAILVEVNGEPAAFAIGLLDYNQIARKIRSGKLWPTGFFKILFGKRKIDRNRIFVLGIRPKFRRIGLGPLMYLRLTLASRELGLKQAEMSWILEDNLDMLKPMRRIGAQVSKTYRMYQTNLDQTFLQPQSTTTAPF